MSSSSAFEGLPEHVRVYSRFRQVFGGKRGPSRDERRRKQREEQGGSVPFTSGRDPRGIGDIVDNLTVKMGWTSLLAREELIAQWPKLVGADTAAHSTPVAFEEGMLTVECDSTAWATQLRLMRSMLLESLAQKFPEAGIESIRFQGPGVPSWKRGPRSVPGRGPRDTYG